jgi:light-regulated signal transduction histidine kinase (bacteriophytochrome)
MSAAEMSATADLPRPDISLCERERIHIPGAIQPHGAMLGVLADGWRVTHASANLGSMIGRSAASVLGMALEDVIGVAACRALQDQTTGASVAVGQGLAIPGPDGSGLHLQAHVSRVCARR